MAEAVTACRSHVCRRANVIERWGPAQRKLLLHLLQGGWKLLRKLGTRASRFYKEGSGNELEGEMSVGHRVKPMGNTHKNIGIASYLRRN